MTNLVSAEMLIQSAANQSQRLVSLSSGLGGVLGALARGTPTQADDARGAAAGGWRSAPLGQLSIASADVDQESLELRLNNRKVALKRQVADFAMHLDAVWRVKLFEQLDDLLDFEQWNEEDELPNIESFRTFMRVVLHCHPDIRPGLGLTSDGHMIAAWTTGRDRLTVECHPEDHIRWVAVKYDGDDRISTATISVARHLPRYLRPYEPSRWFDRRL